MVNGDSGSWPTHIVQIQTATDYRPGQPCIGYGAASRAAWSAVPSVRGTTMVPPESEAWIRFTVHRNRKAYQDGHLDFHTAPEL